MKKTNKQHCNFISFSSDILMDSRGCNYRWAYVQRGHIEYNAMIYNFKQLLLPYQAMEIEAVYKRLYRPDIFIVKRCSNKQSHLRLIKTLGLL